MSLLVLSTTYPSRGMHTNELRQPRVFGNSIVDNLFHSIQPNADV